MKCLSFESLRASQKWLALFNRKIAGIKDRCIGDRKPIRKVIKSYMSLRIEGRDGSVNQIIIENCLIGLNEVEVVEVFEVVLGEKSEKWGGNLWGREEFLQESLQMWGKPRNRKSLKSLISRL